MTRFRIHLAAVAVVLLAAGGALAAGGLDSTPEETGPYADGLRAADDGNWERAIGLFTEAVEEEPESADAWNMLAYSQRMSGDIESAFANYQKALAIDPDHKDAHEYIGEAYLQIGDVAGAEKHLEALDDICWLGCEQLEELREAIEQYKAEAG